MAAGATQTSDELLDLVVVGGGVMGRFTAYHASRAARRIVVLEQGRVGDPATASYGRTRSFRNDYLDAGYARLAHEAFDLWSDFERETGVQVLVRCGCLNLAKRSVTPRMQDTYAERSHAVLERLGLRTASLDGDTLRRRHPFLDADLARIDLDAGVVDLRAVDRALAESLGARGVRTLEGVDTASITREDAAIRVSTDHGDLRTRKLVVTAGHGTNDVLARLDGCELQVPIARDRPSEARYFFPSGEVRHRFTSDVMPVIAYLDAGIYCHPIVEGVVEAVKIGYYNPPDMPRGASSIDSIRSFVDRCMPGLRDTPSEPVQDVDQCDYDLVADDEFVLGAIPRVPDAFVGVGWRGTGYKFAPWVGRVLAELALQDGTVYDIDRFTPARFDEGTPIHEPSVAEDPRAAPV